MSKKLKELFEKITTNILNAISECTDIDKCRVEYMKDIISRVEIFSGDENPEIKDFFVRIIPTVQENILFLRVQLYMPKTEENRLFISALYHEIMHILSVGRIQVVSQTEFFYKCGLCVSKIFVKDGKLFDKSTNELEKFNEALTDICAEYFYNIFEKDKYCAKHFINPIMRMCNCSKVEKYKNLIIPYVLNDEDTIRNHLIRILGQNSMEEFDKTLKENFLL